MRSTSSSDVSLSEVVAGAATGVAQATNEQVARLGASSQEIGNVVKVMQHDGSEVELKGTNVIIAAGSDSIELPFAKFGEHMAKIGRSLGLSVEAYNSAVGSLERQVLPGARKFTELYNVQRLKSSFVAKDSQVCISTIQRLYSILKGSELDEAAEEVNPAELKLPKEPMPVVYNEKIPPEFFDFIFIDECHESIYNLWRQVPEYFDASLSGLTATPDSRT